MNDSAPVPEPLPDPDPRIDRQLAAVVTDFLATLARLRAELVGHRETIARFARYDELGRASEALSDSVELAVAHVDHMAGYVGRARDALNADEPKS